jgi:hypothetical protein
MVSRSVVLLAPLALLAGCGSKRQAPTPEDDPAMNAALQDRIMVDPDLVGQNRANAAAMLPDGSGSIPVVDSSPEAIAAARSDALGLVGGPGRMKQAPDPRKVAGSLPPGSTLTAAARAAASPGGSKDCAGQVSYTAGWAAKMPETFPVYPRGAVQEAAGTDEGVCRLRVVNFLTPVPLGDVIDFYFTRAIDAGFATDHALIDGENTFGGSKGDSSFVVYAHRRDDGLTSVDLVTNGG